MQAYNHFIRINMREREKFIKLLTKSKQLFNYSYVSSHDLQEPLRTITQFTQLFNEKYAGKIDEDGKKYIEFIGKSAVRMSALVKDLLDYSLLGKESVKTIVDCNKMKNKLNCGLLVDDNESDNFLHKRAIENANITDFIGIAMNGEEASSGVSNLC